MNNTIAYILPLLKAYLKGEIHPQDNQELRDLFEKYPDLLLMINQLDDEDKLHSVLVEYKKLYTIEQEAQEKRVLEQIMLRIHQQESVSIVKDRRRTIRIYISAVAACLLMVFTTVFLKFKEGSNSDETKVFLQAQQMIPGSNRATLTSADGANISLNEDRLGIVMGDEITYDDGSVLVDELKSASLMMTLSTPKGGQYQIVLADGTKVWLNADSKLVYPKIFTESQRVVELVGEAYFEVATNKQKPFIVHTENESVEVLGTHFNIKSYPDEKESKVSLLEGKVKVSIPNTVEKVLSPGQQSVVIGKGMRIQDVDLDEIMAWKNGEFMFNNESLVSALRQVSRWYDIDIQVDPSLSRVMLWGTVSRLDNFDKVLKIIKMTDDNIKINLDGRKVRIMK